MDSEDYKGLTDAEMNQVFDWSGLKSNPLHHQKVVATWAMAEGLDRLMLWMGVGVGKTYTSLILSELWVCNRILVLCPPSVVPAWIEQVKMHTDRSIYVIDGPAYLRWEEFYTSDENVIILPYDGLKYVFGDIKDVKRWSKGELRDAQGFVLDDKRLLAVKELGFDCVIMDEIHHIRNPQSVQSRAAIKASGEIKHAIGMTGTPIANDAADLWAAYFAVDRGKSLGPSRNAFIHKYGYMDPWKRPHVRKSSLPAIRKQVSPVTMQYARHECIDLPPETREVVSVEMSDKQTKLTNQLRTTFAANVDNKKITVANALVATIKLAQVANGFIQDEDGNVEVFNENPKIEILKEVVSELEEKCIIFHAFETDGQLIEKAMKKMGIHSRSLRGEITHKQREKALNDFKNDPSVRVLIAHPQCGGEGLNLQFASVAIFYSCWYEGMHVREQAEGRISRTGQTKPVLFIDIVAERSVDEAISHNRQRKQNTAKAVVDWIKKK